MAQGKVPAIEKSKHSVLELLVCNIRDGVSVEANED
jgi:hypothetical protein